MATDSITINVSDNTEQINLTVTPSDSPTTFDPDEGSPYYVGAELDVKRISNGVTVTATDKHGTTSATVYDGEKGEKGDLPMYFGTTAEWAAQTTLVSEKNAFYVWTDYKQVDGENIAGMKLGDGLAYVLDLPFLDAQFQSHAADTDIHVTSEEKAFWNAKNRGFVTGENLILTDL